MEEVKNCKAKIYELMYYFVERVRGFDLEEFAMLKLSFISFGIMIGVMFSGFFKKISPIVKALFVLGYVFMIWQMFFSAKEE